MVVRILAVVRGGKLARAVFLPPDFLPRPLRVCLKEVVPLKEIAVDRRLASVQGLVVAVVNDRLGHPAEDGFDYVEELRTGWEGHKVHERTSMLSLVFGRIDFVNPFARSL